jgi:hypothetical protein
VASAVASSERSGSRKIWKADAESIEAIGGREGIALRADGAMDEMGMSLVGCQEESGGLNRRMNSLNGDLRGRQIAPHENKQVRNLGAGGGHGRRSKACFYRIVRS